MGESRANMYPSGNVLAAVSETETTPTSADLLSTFNGDQEKYISIANLFANPPETGGTTPGIVNASELVIPATNYTASGVIASNISYASITSATPATALAMVIAAPAAGRFLIISQLDAGTVGNTVTLTTGQFSAAKTVATFNAKDETLVLFGISATRFVIIENIGSVAIST